MRFVARSAKSRVRVKENFSFFLAISGIWVNDKNRSKKKRLLWELKKTRKNMATCSSHGHGGKSHDHHEHDDPINDEKEREHFRQVVQSFRIYK